MTLQLRQQLGVLELFDDVDVTDYCESLNSYFVANNIGQVADDTTEKAKWAADRKKLPLPSLWLLENIQYTNWSLSSKFTSW